MIVQRATYILFLKNLCKGAIYLFRVEIQTELPNDETPPSFQKSPIRTEKSEKIIHESFEVSLF